MIDVVHPRSAGECQLARRSRAVVDVGVTLATRGAVTVYLPSGLGAMSGSGTLINDQAQRCREEDVKHSAIHHSSDDDEVDRALIV